MKAVQSDIGLRRSIYNGFMKTCGEFEELLWRRVPESNRCPRICNPLHNHSANAPRMKVANTTTVDVLLQELENRVQKSPHLGAGFSDEMASYGLTVVKPRFAQFCIPPRYHLILCDG